MRMWQQGRAGQGAAAAHLGPCRSCRQSRRRTRSCSTPTCQLPATSLQHPQRTQESQGAQDGLEDKVHGLYGGLHVQMLSHWEGKQQHKHKHK